MIFLAAVLVGLLSSVAWGQGPTNPEYQRQWQGYRMTGGPITCDTTTDLLVDGDGTRISWFARLDPGETETIYICCDATHTESTSATPTPAPCTSGTANGVLDPTVPYVAVGSAARVRCRCLAASGSSTVRVWIER